MLAALINVWHNSSDILQTICGQNIKMYLWLYIYREIWVCLWSRQSACAFLIEYGKEKQNRFKFYFLYYKMNINNHKTHFMLWYIFSSSPPPFHPLSLQKLSLRY